MKKLPIKSGRTSPSVQSFAKPSAFRKWLEENHKDHVEVWVRFHKIHTGKASMTWPESVDEALCFGWIDGMRKRIDEDQYLIRFTPRKKGSTWSKVNIARVEALTQEGRMTQKGLDAFALRAEHRSGLYSYEQPIKELPEEFIAVFKTDPIAWRYYSAQPPSYRRSANHWVVSAKKHETRVKRLMELITDSRAGLWVKLLRRR